MVTPAPVEVDYRGRHSTAWGPTPGPVRPQLSKVSIPQDRTWEGFITDRPSGLLEEMGDGAMVRGSPCLSTISVGASLTSRVITTILQYPLMASLDPTLSWEMGPLRDSSLNPSLTPKDSEENMCLHPGASELASNLNPMASDAGPNLPKPPPFQLPPHLWQPLVANGIAPSTSRPSVASGTAPSSHKPHVASRVAPRLSASSGEGRVAPAKAADTVGGGSAAHSHQCPITFGESTCWCQPSRVSRRPPGVYRPSAAKGLQQPSVVPEETMQRTQSPNHKEASVGTSGMINKVTPGLLWATTVSKLPLTRPQTPKACDRTPGHLPGSMAPGHHWALKIQGDPSLLDSTGSLTPTLPHIAVPGQEKNQTWGTISGVCCPQELVTGHILSELGARLPQGSDNDLARKFSQSSTDCSLNVSNSKSSLSSRSSLSLSTMSVDSLTAVDLVGEQSWKTSLDEDFLSGEAMGRSQRSEDLEEMERVSHGRMTPNLCHLPPPASKLIPILHLSSVPSHMTLSVHWSSGDQDEKDMSSNQRSMGLKESRFQKPDRTKLKRSLSLDNVVIPLYQQPSVTSRWTPSPSQSSVASKVVPNPGQLSIASLSEPSMVCKVTLSLGRPSKACGASPSLAQPSMTIGVAPGLAQLSMTSAVAPRLAQPSITSGVTPRTAHATMGNSVGPSPGHPPVMSGVGHVLSQPIWAPGVSSDLLSSKVSAVAPCPCHPSFLTEVTSNTPHSFGASGIGLGLSQPSVATGVDRHQDPMIGCGVASNLQAPEFKEVSPGFHPPLSVGGRCPSTTERSEHSAVTVSTSNLYQSSVTIGKDSCLGQGTRLSQGILFGSMATRTSQGTVAASMLPNVSWGTLAANKFLSMSRGPMCPGVTRSMCRRSVATAMGPRQSQVGSSTAPTSSWASVTGSPFHGQATGVGPGFSPALVPIGLGLSSSKFSLTNVGPSISQVNVDLPITMDHQCPPVSIVTTPSDQQSNAFSQEPVMGMASPLVPGSVANRMTTAVAPVTVASGMAPSPPPGSMTRDVVPRLPLGYMVSCVAQTLPPGSVINGMGQALPPYPMASAEAHSLPSGSLVSGVAQSFPPGFVTSGMAKTLSPGSVVSGMPPRLIVAHGAVGNRRSPSVRPPTNRTSPSLLLGSVASGVGPSVSSGSVASSVVPAFMAKGPNQSLFLGSTATAAGPPSTVGSVAHSPPQGSMLVGLTPRPYHRVMAREESIAPLQASHATGLAEVHPQALEASGRARGVDQVPMILQRASQLSCTLGAMAFETRDGQAIMKPEDLNEILSQGSRYSRESIVLEATPLMSESPLVPDVDYGRKFLAEDRSVPKGQRLPLEKAAPSQAKCLTSGMAPVLPLSPTFAKHAKASSVTPILQQRSATNWRDPSSHSMAAREVPSVQTESVKSTGASLAHQASVAHIMPWNPSAACVPQGPSASHMPRSHSHEMVACTVISGSHKLAPGSSVAPSLHLGSVSGMGTPSTSQRSGVTSVASHVLPYPSKASRAALGGLQVEAVPSVVWKPVSGNLSQSSHHQSLGPRKSYRSKHSSFVSRILDGSVAKIKPSQQVGEHASRSTQGGPKGAVGVPPAIKPITRTGDFAHDMTIPRLHHGVQRVCLGYESSPSGSQKPLFNWESLQGPQDFHSAVTPVDSHRAPLTPTVLQGPGNTGVAGGQTRNAAVPSVVISSMNRAVAPGGVWEPARCAVPWDAVGSEAAVDPRRSGKLVASVQAVEKIIVQAVVTIQACARSYLVRRTIKLWHRWAIIIQAAWRGYRVRRNLTQLCRAATIIQAMWRGYYIRRSCAQQTLLWSTWAEVGSRAKSTSKHRCFQSCQPHVCAFCQSLSTGLGNFPTVVMLVASSPRTCHICGHTLPTQVVQGIGQGTTGQAGKPRGYDTQLTHRSTQKLHCQDKAAAVIQSAWRGFVVRRQLRQQQAAAKKLQATWRGHYTRSSLTTDALLGPAVWENPQNMQWSGV